MATTSSVVNTLITRPFESVAGLGLLAIGLPVFEYWAATTGTTGTAGTEGIT